MNFGVAACERNNEKFAAERARSCAFTSPSKRCSLAWCSDSSCLRSRSIRGFGEPTELRQQDSNLMPGFMKPWKRRNLSGRTGLSRSDLSSQTADVLKGGDPKVARTAVEPEVDVSLTG